MLKEGADVSGAQDQKGTNVVPGQFTDLGPAIVSPTETTKPDYTKGVPSQELRKMDHTPTDDLSGARDSKGTVTQDAIEKDGDGPKLQTGKKVVAEKTDEEKAAMVTETAARLLKKFKTEGANPFAKKDDADDKKDDDKDKKDVKEDATADAENARQKAKQAEGDAIQHLDKTTPGQSTVVKEDDQKDFAEDITALFAGENITEAFKKKAVTIFETAVGSRVAEIVTREKATILETVTAEKTAEIETIKEALAEKVDTYLNYVAEEWIKENTLPVENSIRSSIAEDFISGLKNLFEAHYIEIPDSKVDVVATLASRVEILEGKLNDQIKKNADLSEANKVIVREKVLSNVTEGLTAVQSEKMKALVENVEFKDEDSFKQSLNVLRESYFPVKGTKTAQNLTEDKSITLETPVEQPIAKTKEMESYISTIKRFSKS